MNKSPLPDNDATTTLCGLPLTAEPTTLIVPNGVCGWNRPDTAICDIHGKPQFVLLQTIRDRCALASCLASNGAILGNNNKRNKEKLVYIHQCHQSHRYLFCTYQPQHEQRPLKLRDPDGERIYLHAYLDIRPVHGSFCYVRVIEDAVVPEQPSVLWRRRKISHMTAWNGWWGLVTSCLLCWVPASCRLGATIRFRHAFDDKKKSKQLRPSRDKPCDTTAVEIDPWQSVVRVAPGNDLLAALCIAYCVDTVHCWLTPSMAVLCCKRGRETRDMQVEQDDPKTAAARLDACYEETTAKQQASVPRVEDNEVSLDDLDFAGLLAVIHNNPANAARQEQCRQAMENNLSKLDPAKSTYDDDLALLPIILNRMVDSATALQAASYIAAIEYLARDCHPDDKAWIAGEDGSTALDRSSTVSAVSSSKSSRHPGGAITAIARVMTTYASDATVQACGCSALDCLAHHVDTIVWIAEQGGLAVILNAMRLHTANATVQQCGCHALRLLACHHENQSLIAVQGGVAVIGAAMKQGKSLRIQLDGLSALYNLVCGGAGTSNDNDPTKALVVQGLGVGPVLDAMEAHPTNTEVQVLACELLYELANCQGGGTKQLIVMADSIPMILSAMRLHQDHDGVQKSGCMLLATLVSASAPEDAEFAVEACHLIQEFAGVTMIANAMKTLPNNPYVQAHGCALVVRLVSTSRDMQVLLVEEGCLERILQALEVHPTFTLMRQHGCNALYTLALDNPAVRSRLLELGSVEVLDTLLELYPKDVVLKSAAADLLRLLDPDGTRRIGEPEQER